jgi:hypothetical protein
MLLPNSATETETKRTAGLAAALLKTLLVAGLICLAFSPPAWAQGGSGGEIIDEGGYTIHTFRESGTFSPPAGVTEVEVLVVGGGGGGSGANPNQAAGGGGAGGVLYDGGYQVNAPVSVSIGAGGAGGPANGPGIGGEGSVFGTLMAAGGGAGGSGGAAGGAGGSGGGGGAMNNAAGAGGSGTSGQGNDGGSGLRGNVGGPAGGGGGGAGAAGLSATAGGGGAGGEGKFFVQFSHAGAGGWFAGGGGGGSDAGNNGGPGGIGGGGAGGGAAIGIPALSNTGGGGGGAGGKLSGGAGGSGIVIVRYLTPENSAWIEGDVSLVLGPDIIMGGQGQGPVIDNSSSILRWASLAARNKITVRISGGAVPAGLLLSVAIAGVANAVEVSPGEEAQELITDIGAGVGEGNLIYTLVVEDFAELFAQAATITLEYTIVPEL